MGSPLIFPKFRAFDHSTGAPLAGGLLVTSIAGTSTPQATYTNASLSTPNTNPVVLDANGEADIWLGSLAYKFQLYNAAFTIQWTEDNVSQAGVVGFQSSAQISAHSPPVNSVDQAQVLIGLTAQSPVISSDPLSEFTSSNGRFTAATTGVYFTAVTIMFSLTGVTLRANGYPVFSALKNNATTIFGQFVLPANNVGTGLYTMGSNSGIVQLNAGDFITAYTVAGFTAGVPTFYYDWSVFRLY